MKYAFMGRCVADAALMSMTSLNEPASFFGESRWDDAEESEIGDQIADPDALGEDELGLGLLAKQLPDFLGSLKPDLHDITYRYFWLGHTQARIAEDKGVTQSAIAHALRRMTHLGRQFFGITEH